MKKGVYSQQMTALLQRWRIGRGHPSRNRLIEALTDAPGDPAATSTARHLARCAPCRRRADELRAFLDALADAADASFDDAFPTDRLQGQRARIDHRLARAVGKIEPARVLAFPFGRTRRHPAGRARGRRALTSAAAGLVLGLVAGQLAHPPRDSASAPGAAVEPPRAADGSEAAFDGGVGGGLPPAAAGAARPANLTLSEFERVMAETALLDTVGAAAVSLPVTELASIDALTPRVRDLPAAGR